MANILLEIVTPTGSAVRTETDQVEAPSVLGEFGVLPGHAPLLASLRAGVVRYRVAGKINVLAVGTGFAEVASDRMTILTDSAIDGTAVNLATARTDRDEAQKKLDAWSGELAGVEYEELERKRDWFAAQLDAAKELGRS